MQRGVQHVCAERRRGFGGLRPRRRYCTSSPPPASPSGAARCRSGAGCSGRAAAGTTGLQQSFAFGTEHRPAPESSSVCSSSSSSSMRRASSSQQSRAGWAAAPHTRPTSTSDQLFSRRCIPQDSAFIVTDWYTPTNCGRKLHLGPFFDVQSWGKVNVHKSSV